MTRTRLPHVALALFLTVLILAAGLPAGAAYTKLYKCRNTTGITQSHLRVINNALEVITGSTASPGELSPPVVGTCVWNGVYCTKLRFGEPSVATVAAGDYGRIGWRTADNSCRLSDLRWVSPAGDPVPVIDPVQLGGVPGGGEVWYDSDNGQYIWLLINDTGEPIDLSDVSFEVLDGEPSLDVLMGTMSAAGLMRPAQETNPHPDIVATRVLSIVTDYLTPLRDGVATALGDGQLIAADADDLTDHLDAAESALEDGLDAYDPADPTAAEAEWDGAVAEMNDFSGLAESLDEPAPLGTTELVSVGLHGKPADQASDFAPSVSGDGRYVAFSSYATNLVPEEDLNPLYPPFWTIDVFVRDLQTGVTERVSEASDGTQANGSTYMPCMNADGRFVSFCSYANNLVPGDTNGKCDIFLHDRQTGETSRVSVASNGTQGNGTCEGRPSISADGRYVAFHSDASNLVPGDTNGQYDIFVRDLQAGVTQRVSVASGGTQANGLSYLPCISPDGRFIAFASSASNLVPGVANGKSQTFVHDRLTGETECVSLGSDGTPANDHCSRPSMSAGGRYIAFASVASNLVDGDTNDMDDVFVHDRLTGETSRVSVASDGTQGNSESYGPSISADGRYVAFTSHASNLVPGDTNGAWDAFVHDRLTGLTQRVSVATGGAQAYGTSEDTCVSGDGRLVVFSSDAANLVSGDTNGVRDFFVHDRSAGGSLLPVDIVEEWLAIADAAVVAIDELPGPGEVAAAELPAPTDPPEAPTPPGDTGTGEPYTYEDWEEIMEQPVPTLPADSYTALTVEDSDGVPNETLLLRTLIHEAPVESAMMRTAQADDVILECVELYTPTQEGVRGPDTTAPSILSASARPELLGPADDRMVPMAFDVQVADTDDAGLVQDAAWHGWYIESVACTQPEDGDENWVLDPDDLQSLQLRAGPEGRTYTVVIRAVDQCGNLSEPRELAVKVLNIRAALTAAIGEMQAIAEAHPGTDLAEAMEDAIADAGSALAALNASPVDSKAAGTDLKRAVGHVDHAVDRGLLGPLQGNSLMWDLCTVTRALAVVALDQAIAEGGKEQQIAAGQRFLAQGDDRRDAGDYFHAASKYNEALRKADAALQGGVDWTQITSLSASPTAAGAEIVFTLSSAAQVEVDVLNIAGRLVRTIVADRDCEAGITSLAWNCRSDRGVPVPSGAYLVRVTARTEDGTQSSRMAPLLLRR